MFFSSPSVSAALVVAAAEFLGYAAASPVPATGQNASAVPGGLVLQPAPIPASTPFNKTRVNLALSDQDNFYWGSAEQGVVANMHVKAADGYRLLNSHQFSDAVHSVDCSNDDITVKFKNAATMRDAKGAWGWVNQAPGNKAVYVVDGNSCGGQNGRQPFIVNSIAYNNQSSSAVMEAVVTSWSTFIGDANIQLSGADAQSTKRGLHKSVTIDTSHDFSRPIFSDTVDGLTVSATCTSCKTSGKLNADISISLSGVKADFKTCDDFGVELEVNLKVSGKLTNDFTKSVTLATIPLAGIAIGGILDLGPELTFDAQASLSGLTGELDTTFGVNMTLPDDSSIGTDQDSTDLMPRLTVMPPALHASVSLVAKAAPVVTLNLAATFLGKGIVGGLALLAPSLTATIKAEDASTDSACGTSSSTASFEIDLGLEVDVFAGLGSAGSTPNKKPIFTKSKPLVSECVSIF